MHNNSSKRIQREDVMKSNGNKLGRKIPYKITKYSHNSQHKIEIGFKLVWQYFLDIKPRLKKKKMENGSKSSF